MAVNTAAYRKLRPGSLSFLEDGVIFEARSDDPESYLIITADKKKIDGYLSVLIRLADGFPVIGDIVTVEGHNDIILVEEKSARRLRKYEALADFFVPSDRKKVVKKKVSSSVIRKETEASVFLRLVEELAGHGAVRSGDVFVGDSVYGIRSIRMYLSQIGCLVASPINEANATGALGYILRTRDAAVSLLQRLDFKSDEALSSEEFAFAHALSVVLMDNLRSLLTPVGAIKMRYVESLVGVKVDLASLIMFAYARRKRSGVSEGYNAVVKTHYVMVNRGKKLLVKGRRNVRRLLVFKIVAEQLSRLGEVMLRRINALN